MQGPVELSVAGAVEPVPHGVSAAGRNGCCTGEGGERGLVADPAGVGPGDDELGRLFEQGLIESGVKPRLFKSQTPTGRVLSLITPPN